jgi:tetratricopeptide (TPR) repeat protein
MNVTDYVYLINQPRLIHNGVQTEALEKVIDEFPYFQSARALQLKGLYTHNSFKYNAALKTTAAHSADRSVLFDFITSDTFIAADKLLSAGNNVNVLKSKPEDSAILADKIIPEIKFSKLEQSILTTIKKASVIEIENLPKKIEEKLKIGKPLDFLKKEQHSFQEWLQLSSLKPIERAILFENAEAIPKVNEEKRKKTELIDKFIETSPKISAVKTGILPPSASPDSNANDHSHLMTETLARVYLEQKKYQKAIQAYEILILKYPEKSSFFAKHIIDIKFLQHNNI